MSATQDTLNSVLANVQNNQAQIAKQLAASTAAAGNPTPEVQAAIDLLVLTYGPNPQTIGSVIGAQMQIEQLNKTAVEVNALIAGLQVVLSDEALVEAAESLAIASGATINDPLSDATGNSQPPAADGTAPAAPATGATEAGVSGNAATPDQPSNGASA